MLNKKMILLKKIYIENCFLVGLSAILKSVLHLKYEKITVINNMQLLHYIDTVPLFVQEPYTDVHVFAMKYGIKSLLEIYTKFLSLLKFLINKFP